MLKLMLEITWWLYVGLHPYCTIVALALLGNHSGTITIACGYSKSTYYGTNTLCV